jgi:uncharacterized protein involved in propanediol utilization
MRSDAPAVRVSGHFGEWLQGRNGADGSVVLVTLCCGSLFAEATMVASESLQLSVTGPEAVTKPQLAQMLRSLGRPESGSFTLSSNLPLGVGAGSSTAALVALARAAGGEDPHLPAACLGVEGATDPLMLPNPDGVLWASREAKICARFTAPPMCEIVGGYLGDPIRTDATDMDFPDIADLLPAWRMASDARDLRTLAALASEAARRTTQRRGPAGDPSGDFASRLGALGHARAHTGSARAFIFAPGTVPTDAERVLERAGLTGAFRFFTGSDT